MERISLINRKDYEAEVITSTLHLQEERLISIYFFTHAASIGRYSHGKLHLHAQSIQTYILEDVLRTVEEIVSRYKNNFAKRCTTNPVMV